MMMDLLSGVSVHRSIGSRFLIGIMYGHKIERTCFMNDRCDMSFFKHKATTSQWI